MRENEKRLTVKEAFERIPEVYKKFITLKEMEEWQKLCKIDRYSRQYYEMKLSSNRNLCNALWKYSRGLDFHGFEHGLYEWFMQALQYEADSLEDTIKKMKGDRVTEV